MTRSAPFFAAFVVCVATVACSKSDPLFCDENTPCSDPALPFCDLRGEYPGSDGIGKTCIASPFDAGVPDGATTADASQTADGAPADANTADCVPNTSTCAASSLAVCGADGKIESVTACPLGCHSSAARCNEIDPSNGLASYLDDAKNSIDLVLTDGATIDTTAGSVTNGNGSGVAVPSSFSDTGRPVGLFIVKVKSLVASNVAVTGSRALAIVSDGDIRLTGVMSVSANATTPGPGALGTDGTGCAGGNGGSSTDYFGGGGGGGFGSNGGRGGDSSGVSGGTAGQVAGDASLAPLWGGCRGGGWGTAYYGAGGGAIQLVSRTAVRLAAGAYVAANGGGALALDSNYCTTLPNVPCTVGSGGGSGGGVLLEAPTVVLTSGSGVVANGGGGSCGLGGHGQSGQLSDQPASGGDCASYPGGNGAAGSVGAANGSFSTVAGNSGGGGGGGVGRIRVNLPLGASFSPGSGVVVSPAATTGVLKTR